MKLPWKRLPRREHEANQTQDLSQGPTVRLRRARTLELPSSGARLVTSSIGPTGEIVALWSDPSGSELLLSGTTQPGWATFPNATAPAPVSAVVTVQTAGIDQVTALSALELAHPHVQPLPGGEVLVVGSRCNFRQGTGAEKNAVRYDARGDIVAEATFGDGIEHVLATGKGDAWVAYFDEGVFGNYGWGAPDGPEPVGAPGLVRFSIDLQADWRFAPEEPFNTMADCYALNVYGESAFACYYTDFPIVSIAQDRTAYWRNPTADARALVTSGTSVVMAGGYDGDRDRIVFGRFGAESVEVIEQRRLVLPDGTALSPAAKFVGRGPVLYVFNEMQWLELDLGDIGAGG